MRKLASSALGLAVILGALSFTAGPAAAKSKHHHHRKHHHHHVAPTPATPTCGAGTVLVTALNQCVPFPFPPGFVNPGGGSGAGFGGSGITISPNTVFLTPLSPPVAGKGTFSSSFTMSGLPPLTSFTVTGGDAACPMTGGGAAATTATITTITFTLSNTTPATPCTQGLHAVNATSPSGAIFTAFVNFTA